MTEAFYLTQRDRELLDKMHRSWSHSFQLSNSSRLDQFDYDDIPQAPECYIALVPEAGIPPLEPATGTGEATFAAGDRPGSAECKVYNVVNGELKLVGLDLRVWNLTETEILQGWITVVRDKFGTWTPVVGGTPCTPRSEEWSLTVAGSPTGGTFDMDVNVLGTTETLTFNWDDTSTEVATELATHTNIGSGDVSVGGGPFPNADITIAFQGDLAEHSFDRPLIDFALLTGGTGVLVVIQRWTPGAPKDGSVAP